MPDCLSHPRKYRRQVREDSVKQIHTEKQQQGKTQWIDPILQSNMTGQTVSQPATVGFKRPPQGQFVFIIYQN